MTLRRCIAVAAGRLAGTLSRRLGRGGGTALPGLVALSLDPGILPHLARQIPQGAVLITGTNGKTTTSRMLAEALRAGAYAPLQNRTGSNLLRGITAAFLARTSLRGRLKVVDRSVGVFEVDEAVLPLAIPLVQPRVVLITNLFRDQLDRYGEVDTVRSLWQKAVASLPEHTTVVLNADDPAVASLGDFAQGPVLYFGIEDHRTGSPVLDHAADSLYCLRCGRPYEYTAVLYSHLGHYRCPQCGKGRPRPQVSAGRIAFQSFERTQYEMDTPQGRTAVSLNLGGLYNVYNALGAASAAVALGLPLSVIREALARFTPAFGRMERLDLEGRRVCLILVKNPTGFNQVLRTLGQGLRPHTILMVLNDQIADGQDISWVWDVDFEELRGPVEKVLERPVGEALDGPPQELGRGIGEAHELPLHPLHELERGVGEARERPVGEALDGPPSELGRGVGEAHERPAGEAPERPLHDPGRRVGEAHELPLHPLHELERGVGEARERPVGEALDGPPHELGRGVGEAHERPVGEAPDGPPHELGRGVGEAHELPLHPLHEHPLLMVSGSRAEDLALRLKYAGLAVPQNSVERDLDRALDLALKATPVGETLCILPTYTAMLVMQRLLARRGHLPHYWEEE